MHNNNAINSRYIIIIVLNLMGCTNKKVEITNKENNENQEELVCLLNEKLELNCNDTILQEYDENNNLILYKENNNGELEEYQYNYSDKNLLEKVTINNNAFIDISYDAYNRVSSIIYNNNDYHFDYSFTYNENNDIKEIEKTYDDKKLGTINYEYYVENNANYVKETDNTQKTQKIRIFKKENILSNNAFQIINYMPSSFITKSKYLPFCDLTNINTDRGFGHYTPIFVSKIEKEITSDDETEKITNYHYDKKDRLIFIDNIDSYNYYEDTDNKTTRTTIYKENNELVDITRCYKYEIIYEYDNNNITRFTKYKKIQLTDKEYMKLKDKFLKYVYSNENI